MCERVGSMVYGLFIYWFIYLLDIYSIYSATVGLAHKNAKKRDKKKDQRKNGSGQKAKPSTSTQETDAHMREEEKNRKQKEEQKKETGSGQVLRMYDVDGGGGN